MNGFRIVVITDANRKAAIRFANRAFFWEFCDPGSEVACEPRYIEERKLTSSRYWAMVNGGGNVIGVTGICDVEGEAPENCHLGYFILHKSQRGRGFGKQLLAFTEEQARLAGKRRMRVLTPRLSHIAVAGRSIAEAGTKSSRLKNRRLEWRVRKSVVLPESVRKAVSDQYNWYLRL